MSEAGRYQGTLALHDDGEGMDILFLDGSEREGDRLAEVIGDDTGRPPLPAGDHLLADAGASAIIPREPLHQAHI